MSESDDFDHVIAAELPDDLVEELIRGAYEPELPDELVRVGRVLRAANGPIPAEERAREEEVVAAMLDAMDVVARPAVSSSWLHGVVPRGRRRRVLIATAAAVSVFGVGGVAAAAGNLPTPVQSFVHDTLSHVGVSVPDRGDDPSPPATTIDAPDAGEADDDDVTGDDPSPPAQTDGGPGKSGDAPGHSGVAPGQSGDNPGKSEDAPGHTGDDPGQSGSAPGQSGEGRGRSGDAPGLADGDNPSGPQSGKGNDASDKEK
jgi:hypothetical protein